jgi:hypothetical protein
LLIEQLENLLQITADKSEDIEERIREGTKELIKAIISDDKMTKITVAMMQLVITNQDFFSKHMVQELYNGFYKTIRDTLMEGIKKGKFRPDVEKNAQLIAVNFLAYIDGILIHYYMDKEYFDLEKQVDFYIDNLLNSLRISK